MTHQSTVQDVLTDCTLNTDAVRDEVLAGLSRPRKKLMPKLLYDECGSRLFDQICDLKEYYLTRAEVAIMREHVGEIVACLGRNCLLIELGSGSSRKTRVLLDHLEEPAGYVPIDISREHLLRSAADIAQRYPHLRVLPVCADFADPIEIPPDACTESRRVIYFPGSTIGNFEPADSEAFLNRMAALCGSGGGLLLGVDLKKDPSVLERAYNDRHGITAAFNLNLLVRLNRELAADFRVEQFQHRALYNSSLGRIEMHIVSLEDQVVQIDGVAVAFERGESIHTESSYKFSLDQFRERARDAGLDERRIWTDRDRQFSVQYLTVP